MRRLGLTEGRRLQERLDTDAIMRDYPDGFTVDGVTVGSSKYGVWVDDRRKSKSWCEISAALDGTLVIEIQVKGVQEGRGALDLVIDEIEDCNRIMKEISSILRKYR